MTDPTDSEIRTMFDELRADDATSIPTFASMVAGPIPFAPRRIGRRALLAAVAAGAIIAAATVILWSARAGPSIGLPEDITQWKSPTDILLDMSRESIAPRDFNASVLDSFNGI